MSALWQYSMYEHGHGFFSLFSHGSAILAACVIFFVIFAAVAVLREK